MTTADALILDRGAAVTGDHTDSATGRTTKGPL